MRLWENVALVVSAITPASALFIAVPVLFAVTGTGTPAALAIAGVLGLALAFCWAELGSMYPLAGGDYTFIARILGRAPGFLSLILTGPVAAAFIPPIVALGLANYLGVVVSLDANVLAVVVMLLGTLIALIGIKVTARAVSILLAFELLTVLFVAILGFINARRGVEALVSFETFGSDGAPSPLGVGALLSGVAIASLVYNGFQGAIVFSEETIGGGRRIAKGIFLSLGIAVASLLIPVAAVMLGAPAVDELVTSSAPWQVFLTAVGGETFNTIVSLGISIAIVNAVVALIPFYARVLYSSGRDNAWPRPVSAALAKVHPRFGTPWVAIVAIGVVGATLAFFADLVTLTTWVATALILEFILVCAAAFAGRIRLPQARRPYKMPLWPVPPIVGAIMLVVVLSRQTIADLAVVGGIAVLCVVYYLAFLWPRRSTHLLMLAPPDAVEEAHTEVLDR